MRLNLGLALIIAISTSSVFAQTDFFWSFNNQNSGATNSDAEGTFMAGESGSLFLYYTTNGPADSDVSVGAFLDIATSRPGVIAFTGAETFDFCITVGGTPIDNRWLDDMGGGGSAGDMDDAISGDGQFIDEYHAFTITGGSGILENNTGPVFLDAGYDSSADAFLFGRIDFTVLGGPGPATSVDILTSAGAGQIISDNSVVPTTFGGATIIVTGGPTVPEPTTAGLMALGLVGLIARRRR